MVAARTKDIDDLLLECIGKGIKQLVFVGVGFDFRIFRLLKSSKDIKVFEVDLPGMLLERDKILATIEGLPCIQRETIGINLELEDLNEVLRTRGFNSSESSLFIIEGLSMYLDENTNKKILSGVNKLMQNKNSMLWIDIVAKKVIERKSGPEVQEFLNGMEKLGEPFIFGLDHPETFFDELGYDVYKKVASSFYKSNNTDLIFNLYNFYAVTSKNGNA